MHWPHSATWVSFGAHTYLMSSLPTTGLSLCRMERSVTVAAVAPSMTSEHATALRSVQVGNSIRPLAVIIEREFSRFVSQRARLISALIRPLFWLVVVAAGFKSMMTIAPQPPYYTDVTYDFYMIPGLLAMICLFNGMQSSLAMVYDRESGAMKVLMTAPLSRLRVLLFKLIAVTLVSLIQVYLFIAMAIMTGVDLPWIGILTALPALSLSAYSMALFGLVMASRFRGLENFSGVMNFVIFPTFFLSSALYPLTQLRASNELIYWVSVANPFTHLTEMIRFGLHGSAMVESSWIAIVIVLILTPITTHLFRLDDH